MTDGWIFDIKRFAVFDGPGIRTTIFFQGCGMHCIWCHNPEGLRQGRHLMIMNGCDGCGRCAEVCPHGAAPGFCTYACGKCVEVCPRGIRRISGRRISAKDLAQEVLGDRDELRLTGGGYSFSGGEPLLQVDFLCALAQELRPSHLVLETAGCVETENFVRGVQSVDFVYFDLKHPDPVRHKKLTGVSNEQILKNLEWMKDSGRPFCVRLPLIPGINDDRETLEQYIDILQNCATLRVEGLPYNRLAGAKYAMLGIPYTLEIDERRAVQDPGAMFEKAGISFCMM